MIPRPEQAARILRDLFERGLLVCAPGNPFLYQLKQ